LNHRVKNNLQIVGSLIRLQSRAQKDPSVTALLESVNQRLFAVADLHSELETGGSGFASSKQFFERIVRRIIEVSEAPGRPIVVAFDLDDVALPVDQAVPLGLILNETVTNSVKHAFATAGGALHVTFKVDCGVAELTVRDDGRPVAGGRGDGLGSRIVALLTRQIRGAVTVEDKNGRIVRVVAPLGRPGRPDAALVRAAE
jgi:two-component sensor histidine kinase